MNYRKVNNLVGWLTGLFATIIYLVTMEPTTSFWDCGEFISVAHRLEVGHQPGAPFFMLLGRLFSIFAPTPESVGAVVNSLSAVMSGLTILFLYWSITHFSRRISGYEEDNVKGSDTWLIIGSGLVGALAYTFSDTFWFSAVEGEVYATSSFLTAIVFWAILKWEERADEPHADRWILLIAYIMGISVGVHLLNLLAIPAIGMVYYFRRYKVTRMGMVWAFLASCGVLALVQFGVIQGVPKLAALFELTFVNTFHLPYDIGAIFFVVLLVAGLIWLLRYARRTGKYTLHLSVLSFLFILMGFSSYLATIIRSRADVPIDMSNPDNVVTFLPYVQREQFGQQPLLYGPDFDAQIIEVEEIGKQYARAPRGERAEYIQVGVKNKYKYEADKQRVFPRIWDSNDPQHVRFYQQFLGLNPGERPTSFDNLSYFLGYQINWMWWRYVMWNYAGRQNDMEGQGDPKNGNWVSGIKFLDKMRVGDMDLMSDGFKNNKARNQFYFLPLIFGIMGLVFQFNKNKRDGLVVLILFFFTGIATAIYLNMPPLQPRERDYAFAGSTYAYAIWIGLGVMMLKQLIDRIAKGGTASYAAVGLGLLAVPVIMVKDTWDDHDRSKKYLARDSAYNTLQSCEKNAILFTFADNDTYPLWYLQEVEKVRRDVRVINLSLLGIDWYIDQLNYKVNEADPVPMIWPREAYMGDRSNYVRYSPNPQIPKDQYFSLEEVTRFMSSNDPAAQVAYGNTRMNYLPSRNVFISNGGVNSFIENNMIKPADTAGLMTDMRFTISKESLYKGDLAVLNIIAGVAQQGWKRPVYFCGGLSGENFLGMEDYTQLEGINYRVVPFRRPYPTDSVGAPIKTGTGFVDLNKSLDLFYNTYRWGNADKKDVYFDEKNRLTFISYRVNAARLANELVARGRKAEAIKILDHVMKNITEQSYFYDLTILDIVSAYYRSGAIEQARLYGGKLAKNAEDDINWISGLSDGQAASLYNEIQKDLYMVQTIAQSAAAAGDQQTATQLNTTMQNMYQKVSAVAAGMMQPPQGGAVQ